MTSLQTHLQKLYEEIEREYRNNAEEIEPGDLVKNPNGDIISQEQAKKEIDEIFIKRIQDELTKFLEEQKICEIPSVEIVDLNDLPF